LSSEKNPAVEPVASLQSATAKTRSAIEGLHARLSRDAAGRPTKQVTAVAASRKRNVIELEETDEDLDEQLQTYFARASVQPANVRAHAQDDLRSRVVEGVVHRILADWARRDQELPGSARLGNEIMERLIQRVLEQFQEVAMAS
jgi:hypothetical protein